MLLIQDNKKIDREIKNKVKGEFEMFALSFKPMDFCCLEQLVGSTKLLYDQKM